MAWLDTLLAVIIIAGLLLAIISKLTHQKITDLFRDIGDYLGDRKEAAQEATTRKFLE